MQSYGLPASGALSQEVGLAILAQLRQLSIGAPQGATGNSLPAPGYTSLPTAQMQPVFRPIPPAGVPQKTLDACLRGEFVDLNDFVPPIGASKNLSMDELEPFIDTNNSVSYRPKKHSRKIIGFDTWAEAFDRFQKFIVGHLGVEFHTHLVDYRTFIYESNRKFTWPSVSMYDFRHRSNLALHGTLHERFAFSKADPALVPIILDATAVRPNAVRCTRCRGFDHVVKSCPFPEGGSKTSTQAKSAAGAQEVCQNFNRERCLFGEQCRRKHCCRLCKGPLPFNKCSLTGRCSDRGKDASPV